MGKIEEGLYVVETRLIRGVRKKLKELKRLIDDDLAGMPKSKVRRSIRSYLRKVGLDDLVGLLSSQFTSIENLLIELDDFIPAFTDDELAKARSAVGLNRLTGNLNKRLIRDIRGYISDGVDFVAKSTGRVQTLVSTGVQGYDNALMVSKMESLEVAKFKYAGQSDSLNRPFCDERVGKIFEMKDVEKWDNGQGLPAKTYLGGYNCRHRFQPIQEDS